MSSRSPQSVAWNPADYAANSGAQFAWARELIARLCLRGDERVLDVGCGDGKVTAELARALPQGEIIGVDSSAAMLRFARETFPKRKHVNLEWRRMDARALRFTKPFDLVFSNAALHWVDDHPAFLRSVAACLKPAGRLVISCGGKGNAQDVFVALQAILRRERWREFFRKFTMPYVFHAPEAYERWLPRFGFRPQLVRLVNKETQVAGQAGFAGWFRTTWLPYTQRVPAEQREEFIAAVVDRFVAAHPPGPTGQLVIRMVRLEIDAVRI